MAHGMGGKHGPWNPTGLSLNSGCKIAGVVTLTSLCSVSLGVCYLSFWGMHPLSELPSGLKEGGEG